MKTLTVRLMYPEEREQVFAWWKAQAPELAPEGPDFMPENSTYVAEVAGTAILSLVCIETGWPVLWLEAFIGNPKVPSAERRRWTAPALEKIEAIAKAKGYRGLFCMAPNERLAGYYRRLGFQTTLTGVTTLTKGV